MIYNNDFTCPDGHPFKANAKLRARCPECGKMARRTYTSKEPAPSPEVVDTGSVVPSPPPVSTTPEDDNGLKLIRRGKPRSIMVAKKATPKKDANGRFISSKKKAPVKKTTALVTHKTVGAGTKKKPTMPRIIKKPPRTAVARHVTQSGGRKSYADEMMENYGFRR